MTGSDVGAAVPGSAMGEEPAPEARSLEGSSLEGPSLEGAVQPSRRGFVARLQGLLRGGRADEETWEEVEEALIAGDVGARLAMEVVARARA